MTSNTQIQEQVQLEEDDEVTYAAEIAARDR